MRRTVIFGAAAAVLCALLTGCGPTDPVVLPALPSAVAAEPSATATPQASPPASVAPSPSARPVASPKPSAKPKPTAKAKITVTSVALKAAFVGSSLEATVTMKTTGYGTLAVAWFAGADGMFDTGTFTVTGTGANTSVRHVSAGITLSCRAGAASIQFSVGPDTPAGPNVTRYSKPLTVSCP